MVVLFVRELTRNLPAPIQIELHGNRIRLNDAKAARLVTAGSYLSFTLREQIYFQHLVRGAREVPTSR